MSNDQFCFDLTPAEFPVRINGDDYILREAMGDVAVKYRNCSLKSLVMAEEGSRVSGDGLAQSEPILVSLCTYRLDEKGVPFKNPVGLNTVLGWPNRVIKPLFEKIKEISDLGEGDETISGLIKERDKLTKKIEKLRKDEEERKNLLETSSDG